MTCIIAHGMVSCMLVAGGACHEWCSKLVFRISRGKMNYVPYAGKLDVRAVPTHDWSLARCQDMVSEKEHFAYEP